MARQKIQHTRRVMIIIEAETDESWVSLKKKGRWQGPKIKIEQVQVNVIRKARRIVNARR